MNNQKLKKNFIIMLVISIIIFVAGIGIFMSAEYTDWYGKTQLDEEQRNAGTIVIVVGVSCLIGSFLYKNYNDKKLSIQKEKDQKDINDIENTLKELKNMYQNKEITKEEYDKRKEILLNRL